MIDIKRMDNADTDFYAVMGRFLSRRSIVDEIGSPIWDDDGKVWFVALSGGAVQGWVAVTSTKNAVKFCSDYILPDFRSSGVYAKLFAERDKAYGHLDASATVSPMSLQAYLSNGFQQTGTRGKYTVVKRSA